MKALVITLPRESWPASMTNHFHIVDTIINRHVIRSVMVNYPTSMVTELEWIGEPPTCAECKKPVR